MSINHAILGLLSYRPLTGYDLKKIIQDSSFMHWSGNNNQIYKSLIDLLEQGFVTNQVQHQESSPSKKIYTITQAGQEELKAWVLSPPEIPEFRKTFLVQLAWADQLDDDELTGVLTRYEYEIGMQMVLEQEKRRRGIFSPHRTAREERIWDMIYENVVSSYEQELAWIKKLRTELHGNTQEGVRMKYQVVEKNHRKYLECASPETPIRTEQDGMDLIAAGMEHETNLLMLHAPVLTDDFFQLKTGLAGSILQKFMNYNIRAAVVIPDYEKFKGRFRELLNESNRGGSFRIFNHQAEAEAWLLNP